MINLIEWGALGLAEGEGTIESPSAEIAALHEHFPGLVAISKGMRREGQPSVYSFINDVVKLIGPNLGAHAILHRGREFHLYYKDANKHGGLRFEKLQLFSLRNARGDQAFYDNAGVCFYALVTVLMGFTEALIAKTGHANNLLSCIRSCRSNMLIMGEAGILSVLWYLVFRPYLGMKMTQLRAAEVVQELHGFCVTMRDDPKAICDWPFITSASAGYQLVHYATAFIAEHYRYPDGYIAEMVRFCVKPSPELSTQELAAYNATTQKLIKPFMAKLLEKLENLCAEKYGDLLKFDHTCDVIAQIVPGNHVAAAAGASPAAAPTTSPVVAVASAPTSVAALAAADTPTTTATPAVVTRAPLAFDLRTETFEPINLVQYKQWVQKTKSKWIGIKNIKVAKGRRVALKKREAAFKKRAATVEKDSIGIERAFGIQDQYMRANPCKTFLRIQGYLLMRDEDLESYLLSFPEAELDLLMRKAHTFGQTLQKRWRDRAHGDDAYITAALKAYEEKAKKSKATAAAKLDALRRLSESWIFFPAGVRTTVAQLQQRGAHPCSCCQSADAYTYLMKR